MLALHNISKSVSNGNYKMPSKYKVCKYVGGVFVIRKRWLFFFWKLLGEEVELGWNCSEFQPLKFCYEWQAQAYLNNIHIIVES